jgi:hypothetical protein
VVVAGVLIQPHVEEAAVVARQGEVAAVAVVVAVEVVEVVAVGVVGAVGVNLSN